MYFAYRIKPVPTPTMKPKLNARERKALEALRSAEGHRLFDDQMPSGVGENTLEKLVEDGLIRVPACSQLTPRGRRRLAEAEAGDAEDA